MKKTLTLLVAVALVLSGVLVSCDKDEAEGTPDTTETTEPDENEQEGNTEEENESDENESDENENEDVDEPEDDDDDYDGEYLDPSWIPFKFDSGTIATGTDGEFYVKTADISPMTHTGDYVLEYTILSNVTRSEFVKFVTKGEYGDKHYDVRFASEADFWDNYKGGSEDDPGMPYTEYYYEPGSDVYNPTYLYSGGDGHYVRTDTYYARAWEGISWGFLDITEDHFFTFGVNPEIKGQSERPYDENGAMYLLVLTLPSKSELYPDITFYGFIHVNDGTDTSTGGDTTPTITWTSNPDFEPLELSADMDVNISMNAPNGIEHLYVNLDSDSNLITTVVSAYVKIAQDVDIITDEDMIMWLKELSVPCGEDIYHETHVDFDLGGLTSLLYDLTTSLGGFVSGKEIYVGLTLEDQEGQKVNKKATLVFPS